MTEPLEQFKSNLLFIAIEAAKSGVKARDMAEFLTKYARDMEKNAQFFTDSRNLTLALQYDKAQYPSPTVEIKENKEG